MRTNLTKSTAVVAVMLVLLSGGSVGLAQTSVSGSATAGFTMGTKIAIPTGYTVIPPDDNDTSGDQILQLENLTIQSISGSVPGTIYASGNIGGVCREYSDLVNSVAKAYPCPLAPTVLYQISVQPDTILLLKNRSRASIGNFAVGDRINIFGFLDRGTSGVQALIVRDLDKPAISQSQYVQLNDLTVVAAPDSSVAPATFQAARRGVEPCLSFASVDAARGVSAPCPMGVTAGSAGLPATMNMMIDANPELYRPFQQYYSVQVSSLTRIMNASRQGLGLENIRVGDHINIYGRYNPSNRTIEALIIRDLSVPREGSSGQTSLVVTVNDGDIVCVTTPCGPFPMNGAEVIVFSLDNVGYATPYVWVQTTVNGQTTFKDLAGAGNYMVRAYVAGYASVEEKIVLRFGETNRVSLSLHREATKQAVPSITSISPSIGPAGTVVTIRGSGFTPTNNVVYFDNYQVASYLTSSGSRLSFSVPSGVSPCPYDPYNPPSEPVVCMAMAIRLPPSQYRVRVVNSNGASEDNLTFAFVDDTYPVPPTVAY